METKSYRNIYGNMNVENVGSSIAMIVDETKPNSNLLLSVESNEDNVINYLKELKLKPKQHFQIIPNISVARDILYVVGASGSGKSYFTRQFVDQSLAKVYTHSTYARV